MQQDKRGAPVGNTNTQKHGAYGLKKRIETGLTTRDDYKRYIALLSRWGLTPADIEGMGMLGSAIEAKAWQGLVAEDATGAYLFVKETSDDLDQIVKLGKYAGYHLSKYAKDLLTLHDALHADDGSIEAALLSARGTNGKPVESD